MAAPEQFFCLTGELTCATYTGKGSTPVLFWLIRWKPDAGDTVVRAVAYNEEAGVYVDPTSDPVFVKFLKQPAWMHSVYARVGREALNEAVEPHEALTGTEVRDLVNDRKVKIMAELVAYREIQEKVFPGGP